MRILSAVVPLLVLVVTLAWSSPAMAQFMIRPRYGSRPMMRSSGSMVPAPPPAEEQLGLVAGGGAGGPGSRWGVEYGTGGSGYILLPMRVLADLREPRSLLATIGLRFYLPLMKAGDGQLVLVPDLDLGVQAGGALVDPRFVAGVSAGLGWRAPRWMVTLGAQQPLFADNAVLPGNAWTVMLSVHFRLRAASSESLFSGPEAAPLSPPSPVDPETSSSSSAPAVPKATTSGDVTPAASEVAPESSPAAH